MSNFTKGAIVRRAESDNRLKTILAADPHPNAGGRPAIFNAWRGRSPNALPQLIIVQAMETDMDLRDQGRGTQGVWRERWHFEAWARSENDIPQSIIAIVKELFHNARFRLDGGAIMLYMQQVGGDPEGYDADLDESFSIGIYDLAYSA
jgi:hypothetical protein